MTFGASGSTQVKKEGVHYEDVYWPSVRAERSIMSSKVLKAHAVTQRVPGTRVMCGALPNWQAVLDQ